MGFKYTLVCDTLSFLGHDVLESPREILQAIKDAGYDGADMPGDPKRMDGKALRQIVDSIGLAVPEVLGAWAFFHGGEDRDLAGSNEEARRRGIEYAKRTIDLAVELGAQFFEICAAQPPVPQLPFPRLPIKTLRQNFLDALREICAYASERGITVLLEPLNCYEAYPGVLTSVFEAVSLVEQLRPYDVGIQPDIYHMNVSDPAIPYTLRAAGKHVRHFHVNETNHYRFGAGHADYRAVIKALKDINYTGYLAVYMPFTTQEACQMGARGYGQSNGAPGQGPDGGPDLKAHLEFAISTLKEIERSLEAKA